MDLEISNNTPYTNFTLTGNQLKIFKYLNKIANNYSLGDIYQGAWQVYKDRNLKDRYSLAAHAFRELIDRLTDEKIGKSSQPPKDIVKEISELYKKWEECKTGELNNFNQELDSFFTSFKNRSGRKERYKNLMIINDPLYKKLPEEVFKGYNKTITELYKYFSNLAHHIHNKNDAENFDKKIAMLEDLLGALFTENIIEKHNNIDEFINEYENNTSDINIELTIDILKGVGANLSYFFKKIKSPKWLVLFENPFFKKHENQDFYDQLQYILAISNNYPEYQDKIALIIYSTIYGDRISEHVLDCAPSTGTIII